MERIGVDIVRVVSRDAGASRERGSGVCAVAKGGLCRAAGVRAPRGGLWRNVVRLS